MALQTKVQSSFVPGIVGEFSDNSPKVARQYLTYGVGGTADPAFGKVFSFLEKTVDAATGAAVTAAQQGVVNGKAVMGILVNPKEHYIVGFKTGRTIANGTAATIATCGHIWVFAKTATVAGDDVYIDANGDLYGASATGRYPLSGAKWLKTTRALATGETEILSEVAINDCVAGEAVPEPSAD